MKRTVLCLSALLFLGACAAQNIGPAPYTDSAAGQMQAWLNVHLKDPDSAKVVGGSGPEQRWMAVGVGTCWVYYLAVNAKNSYGGYTGAQTYSFCFQGGQLTAVLTPDGWRSE